MNYIQNYFRKVAVDDVDYVIDFGERTICTQNASKIIALPKLALQNCGKFRKVHVKLVQNKNGKFIQLIPILS